MQYASIPPIVSQTSLPQTWHIPPRSTGLAPKPINIISITKLKPPAANPSQTKRSNHGITPNVYCPVSTPLPSDQFANDLHDNLSKIGSNSQMFKLLQASKAHPVEKVATEFGYMPHGSALTYQVVRLPTTTTDSYPPFPLPPQPCSFSTALSEHESIFYSGLTVTHPDAEVLEKETRGQSNSKVWQRVRSQRLTSSTFKRIVSRFADFNSLATSMQKRKIVQTPAMKRGLELEPVAAAQYEQITNNQVYPCGFVINPHAPHLGTSPDRKVVDSTGALGLLEIKCPDVDSVLECKYFSLGADGVLGLKTSHEYHYQMTGQMGITGLTWCDFFVKSRNDFHLERIHFDVEKWEAMKAKLDMFFFNYWLPNLCLYV
ncbi:uncharacterized protein LOC130228515 [Danio aesculapii]|uniref:uncharacterized protein LOC130228515 n=1 Tax=Danio aesculapii TaxID=1142201 RepID=UPI0024BFACFD|nr:uncharacterized protein LOC130228515 [Danio aesculapii]